MTYDDNVEDAITAGDFDRLIQYAYGYPCKCKTIKGEPMCECKMQAAALRKAVVPRLLFQKKIQRITTTA